MTQTGGLKKKAGKSVGSSRKQVGHQAKHKNYGKQKPNEMRSKAVSSYINQVEMSMASRLPSDQRDKLTTIKPNNSTVANSISSKKHQKKPLTKGRKRK